MCIRDRSVGSAQNYFQETYAITVNENNFEIVDSEESILSAFNEKTLAYVPIPGNGEADDYKGLNVKDKIALVSRGKISFSEKAYNAAEAGAVGLIVYDNDENGELLTMDCQGPVSYTHLSSVKLTCKISGSGK